MQILDKVKEKFQHKSIDQEIDAAFSEPGSSNSYSKQVLESSGKYGQGKQGNDALSPNYMTERRPEPPRALNAPQNQANGNQQSPFAYDDPALPRYDDPYNFSKGLDTPPPKRDDPLFSEQRDSASTPEERQEFFNNPPPQRSRYSGGMGGGNMGGDDVSRIMLEIQDLRAQNDHIINLLKNIQERLRKY